MRGRKPKPAQLRAIEGNRGKRKARAPGPQPDACLPDCPPHLNKLAKEYWDRYAAELNRLGLLTFVDGVWFAELCCDIALSIQAEEKINELGPVVEITGEAEDGTLYIKEIRRNPWIMVKKQASEGIMKKMSEAGMTPVSRSRVTTTKKKEKPNPLQAWLAQKGKAAVIQGGKK